MIGLFDSGIGGLTVVRELIRQSPDTDFIYLGDTARTPYGNKSPEIIEKYALEDAEYVISQGAELVIVACNTVSSLALEKLRNTFTKVPFIGVIEPAVELAITQSKKSVGVIGTRATIDSGIYEKLIKKNHVGLRVIQKACPLFVPLVEEGLINDRITKLVIRKYLTSIRQQNPDSLILGCTHYPFLKDSLQRFMGKRVKVIDSAGVVIQKALNDYPGLFNGSSDPKRIISFTDASEHLNNIASKWLGIKVKANKANLQQS